MEFQLKFMAGLGWSQRLKNPMRTKSKNTHRAAWAAAAAVRCSPPRAAAAGSVSLLL